MGLKCSSTPETARSRHPSGHSPNLASLTKMLLHLWSAGLALCDPASSAIGVLSFQVSSSVSPHWRASVSSSLFGLILFIFEKQAVCFSLLRSLPFPTHAGTSPVSSPSILTGALSHYKGPPAAPPNSAQEPLEARPPSPAQSGHVNSLLN